MRRAIIVLFIVCIALPLFGKDYMFQIQSEYRRDAVDFEDDIHEFFRQKLNIRFSEKSEANAALVHDVQADASHYTWNLFLRDISPHFSFFAGNFYAHFGKGMLVGKRSAFQADVFLRKSEIFSGDSITPATSGNPYFAFNGFGIMHQFSMSDITIRTLAFYSLKERYVSQKDYESRSTLSSVWSLEKYDDRKEYRIEPVQMHTAGANMSMMLHRLFSIDVYGIRNEAQTLFGDEIVLRDGILRFKGFGFTAQYRDEFINLFSEIASSSTTYRTSEGNESESDGSATLTGISLRSAHLSASCAYKSADAAYFSPYTATIGEYIGQGIFLDARYNPIKKLIFAASASSEKKISPSGEKDIPAIKRERLFCEYSSGLLHALRLEYTRAYRSSDEVDRNRYRGSITLGNPLLVLLATSGTYQTHSTAAGSYCTTTSLSFFVPRMLSAHASWTKVRIGEGNPVYEYLLPLKNSSIPGTFLRASGNVYALKFVFHRWGLYFSCRGILELPENGTRTTVIEAFASGQY